MPKPVKYLFLIASVLGLFLYGVAVGHYHVPPYQQLMEIREVSLFNTIKTQAIRVSGEQKTGESINLNTALQRLYIKEIPLQVNPATGPYHLSVAGNILYVFGHNGSINLYNFFSFKKVEAHLDPLPLGIDMPAYYEHVAIPNYSVNGFRVLGAHVEESPSGDHTVFVTHHRFEDDKECVSLNLSKGVVRHDSQHNLQQIGKWETIFAAEPCLEPTTIDGEPRFQIRLTAGGHIDPLNDDSLLVSTGDAGFDGMINENLSEDPGNLFGKILRIHKNTGQYTIFASGFRNTQGMYVDTAGTIWTTDQGPQGGDELNIVHPGRHYGWPDVSYGIEYGNEPWPHSDQQGRHNGYVKPQFVWPNSIAPTEVLRIENQPAFTEWEGDLLVSTLRDLSLHRLRVEEGTGVLYNERITLGHRIRDMAFLPNGVLALITDSMVLILIDDGGPVYQEGTPGENSPLDRLARYDSLTAAN